MLQVALLAYMDARPGERFVGIFDDLKRYARDTEFHLRLRRIMLDCPDPWRVLPTHRSLLATGVVNLLAISKRS